MEHDGFVGADGNADYLFIQAQCHADIAHLILERFDNFAIDELKQSRPPLHQHDRNAERCQDASIFAANDAAADDRQ